ncbi:MAG: hypothetical protein ACTHMX_15595 [Thermomicrobiales bacterium]
MPSSHPHPLASPAGPVRRIVVTAPDEAALVQAVLDQVLARPSSPVDDAPTRPHLIGFRSVAADLPALLAATVEQAFGEAAGQGARVIAAEISGVMPVDDGVRSWGFVTVVPEPGALAVPAVIGVPVISREAGAYVATLVVDPEGGDA